ncbi:DUF3221 domain-containing protein [Heyndrickxia sp. MSNUG]|uniref:DUF3221 domain-containing protein n=1 Tax=Heyndrickxia sp. MSNUG TaxID=3136677 RepID=UPI003C2BDA5A
MRKHHAIAAILGLALALSGCGTDNNGDTQEKRGADKTASTPAEDALPVNESGWETIEVVNNRAIIAKLKQTIKDTPERDKKIEEYKESKDFQDGVFGKPTDELAESLAMQAVEGSIARETSEKVYGGYKGLEDAAVIFFENSNQNGERMGYWIGVKKADDRLKRLIEEMQSKVDAGEIKAKYIHIFYSPFTTSENYTLTNKVAQALQRVKRQPGTPSRGYFDASVDTQTGEINIGHNFLSDEQKEQLRKLFPDRNMVFEQQGRMIPKEGESDTFYPKKKFTEQPSKEGAYVMDLQEDSLLAVEAQGRIYNKASGEEQFGATQFKFPKASEKLKIGQRVIVEPNGPIMESYPGKGGALYITVLPEYKPAGAKLSESQVVSKAITEAKKTSGNELLIIRELSYEPSNKRWTVIFIQGFQGQELKVELAD